MFRLTYLTRNPDGEVRRWINSIRLETMEQMLTYLIANPLIIPRNAIELTIEEDK